MIGQTLSHYRITAKLGEGGMGEVYRAEDTTLGREVALKILPPELAGSQERLERFQREAKTLAALDHPNIVTIHSVEAAEGVHFLTMQLVEGKQLSELIPKGGMPVDRIFGVAIPLAETLAVAHEKGVVHRDLKPANVMMSSDGRVMVLDFGLAKLRYDPAEPGATELPTEPLTDEGRVLGTVPYMSPEQVEGKPLDHRSDLFSLGVMLYEMATGQRPFHGDSPASTMSAILRDTPNDVDGLRTDLPHHLGRIIRHCLDKDPERRFQSAKDVRNELEDLRQEQASQAEMPAGPASRRRASRITPWLAPVALALVIAAGWLWSRDGREQSASPESVPPMIVVLPFENLGSPDDEYFADGMTEEITSRLAVVRDLRVISRTTAMQYKENRPPVKKIGEELGVHYVLEGSVRWARDGSRSRVRITPQLILVADDSHVWAESYDRLIEDVFSIQSEIASNVVRQLGVTLGRREEELLARRPTENLDAYDYYSRGREAFYEYSVEGSERAMSLFDEALRLDASYVLALAGISLCQARQVSSGWSDDLEWLRKAEETALRAVALDPEVAEAQFALGFAYHAASEHAQAESQMIRVLELNPNHAHAHDTLADSLLFGRGSPAEAALEYETALRLDPLLSPANRNLARAYMALGRLRDATAQAERMIHLGIRRGIALRYEGQAAELRGEYETAADHYRESLETDLGSYVLLADLLQRAGSLGELQDRSEGLRAECTERPRIDCDYLSKYLEMRLALATGDKNGARELMVAPAEFSRTEPYPREALTTRFGTAYLELQAYDATIRWFENALTFYPHMKILHYRLGQALEAAGQPEAAIKSYGTFLNSWQDADPDALPLLEARTRLAALLSEGAGTP